MFDKIIDNLSKNELKQLIVLGRARLQKLQHDNDVSKIPAKTLNKMIEQAEPLYRGKFLEVSIPAYAVLELNIEDQEATYSMIDDYIDYKSIDSSI